MQRRLIAAAIGMLGLLPVSAAAASPSPSLGTLLVPAPAGYATPVTSPYSGHLTTAQFAQTWGSSSAQAESELDRDGFVDAYGFAYADGGGNHVAVEFVIAFTGQSGALRFMGADSNQTVARDQFKHADPHPGLGPYYYGEHMAQASPPIVLDGFEFVKGNDMFGVAFYSSKDDVLALATAQAKKQYDAAPAQTIPVNDWPENAPPPSRDAGVLAGMSQSVLLAGGAVLLLLAAGVFVWMRRGEMAPRAALPAQQMSTDGNYWWGGVAWVSTADVAPPWAQRSPDGAFWWDGRAWRPVPGATQPAPR